MGNFKTRPGRIYKMSHLIADSTEELLEMTNAIGVCPEWIQYAGTYKEHFDITKSKKALAIKAGAIPITTSQLGRLIRNRRLTGSLGTLKEEPDVRTQETQSSYC